MLKANLKALIVDDSDMSRRIATRIVSRVFDCDQAEDGCVAVSKYMEAIDVGSPYDIVFMDVIMPEMDGKEAVRKIREHEESTGLRRTPIVMVSASESLDGIEGMVNGLLRKALSKQALDEILSELFPEALL
jgi:two-component system chemotaxis response regulator CheY